MKNWILKEIAAVYDTVNGFVKDAVYTASLIIAVLGLLLLSAIAVNNRVQIGTETRVYSTRVPVNDIRLILNQSNLRILYSLEVKNRVLLRDTMTIEVIGPKKDRSETWLAIERVLTE